MTNYYFRKSHHHFNMPLHCRLVHPVIQQQHDDIFPPTSSPAGAPSDSAKAC
jgi:hypothetical protein